MDVFRDWPRNLILVTFWLAGPGFLGAVLVVVVGFEWTLFLAVPLLVATAVGVRRSLQAAVVVEPRGLTVRRVWSTRFIPAEEVAALDTRLSLSMQADCLLIRLRSGVEVGVASIPGYSSLMTLPGAEDADVEELERRMRRVFDRGVELST